MKSYNCDDCPYCEPTNNFFTRWCRYWEKVTYIPNGCSRDTTVLDYDYDDSLDEDDYDLDFNEDEFEDEDDEDYDDDED